MPQILVDGELVDISQEKYDALGQGTQATTTATDASAYEQYALLQAKIEGVKQLATADAAVVDADNISPEFQAELDRLQSQADALAGDNLVQFQAQYQNESVALQAQGATNLDALRQELLEDPQPAIIVPGSVPVSTETISVGGEEITAVNTTNNSPQQESAVTNESLNSDIESVNPTVNPQANLPVDIAGAPDPTVAEYFQNKAELEAVQKTFAVEEGDRPTFVANPEERAAFIARLEENNQRLEAELEQKGLLSAVQQAEEQNRIENEAARPPIASLAELYPDDEPTVVSNSEIVGQTVADTAQGEQEILAAQRDVQQTEQQLATAEAELAGTQQEIVATVRAGGEPTTEQLETLAAQEFEVAALEEQLATDEQALVSTQEAQGVDPDPTTLTAAEQAADPEVSAFEEQQAPEAVPLAEIETEATTELTAEQEAADPEVVAPLEEFIPVSEIETEATTELTAEQEAADPEITPVESGIPLGEIDSEPLTVSQDDPQLPAEIQPFSSDLVEVEPEEVDPETDPEIVEPLEEFVAEADIETEDDTELTEEEEAADPEIVEPLEEFVAEADIDTEATDVDAFIDPEVPQQDDFVLSATDIDTGDDLTVTDTGGVPTQTLADIGGDTGVPFVQQDVFAEDVVEYFEDTPDDFGVSDADIDRGNDLTVSDTGGVPTQTLADFTGEDTGGVPTQTLADLTVSDTGGVPTESLADIGGDTGLLPSEVEQQASDAARIQAQVAKARAQQTVQEQRKNVNTADWRVRLRLAPQATYLYKDTGNEGILAPLVETDGVIFPYTPTIQTVYKANYNAYDLTHSNYRGYFYQGSNVDDIQITGTFTAQDTDEANYLLAVIHFFRSVTKMFYGQDPNRGAPPPLVFLSGFGEYQFNEHPCVVSQFNYNLPADVDYIRARSPNINGTNLLKRRTRQDLPTNPFSSALARLKAARLPKGAQRPLPPVTAPTLGLNSPTYVPTKMEITIVLHPMQTRQQVSKQFAVRDFAPGRLQRGGFW